MATTSLLRDDSSPVLTYAVVRPTLGDESNFGLGTIRVVDSDRWSATRADGTPSPTEFSAMIDAVDWVDNDRRRNELRGMLTALAAEARTWDPDATPQAEVDRICAISSLGVLADTVRVYLDVVARGRARQARGGERRA